MAVDTDAPETGISAAPRVNQLSNYFRSLGIRKYSMTGRRRQGGFEKRVKDSVHVSSEAERMIFGNPMIIVRKVFIHIDEDRIAAGNPLLVQQVSQDWELVHWSNRNDEWCA